MMMVAGGGCCGSSFFAMTIDTLGSMEEEVFWATFGKPNPTIFLLRCMWHPQILLAMTFLKHLEVLGDNR